jgi:hypothetical protein
VSRGIIFNKEGALSQILMSKTRCATRRIVPIQPQQGTRLWKLVRLHIGLDRSRCATQFGLELAIARVPKRTEPLVGIGLQDSRTTSPPSRSGIDIDLDSFTARQGATITVSAHTDQAGRMLSPKRRCNNQILAETPVFSATDASHQTITLKVKANSIWAYQADLGDQARVAAQIIGKTTHDAKALLLDT